MTSPADLKSIIETMMTAYYIMSILVMNPESRMNIVTNNALQKKTIEMAETAITTRKARRIA